MTEAKKKSSGASIARLVLTLFAITFVVALLLGAVNLLTEDRIAALAAETKQESMIEVMGDDVSNPAYTYEEYTISDLSAQGELSGNDAGVSEAYIVTDSSGNTVGYCLVTGANGFNGNISVMVGVGTDGATTGIVILDQDETAGMGAKCVEPEFRDQFIGTVAGFQCVTQSQKQDGDGNIQAITGSTITSKAVTRAVNYALTFVENGGIS